MPQRPDTIIAGGRSPASDYAGEVTALESRSDVACLEALHHERRKLYEQNAHLIARYGSFGMHDDFRKSFVECQKLKARMELTAGDKKATEGSVEAAAYGSDAYAAFLDNALAEKVEFLKVQNEIDEINERIQGREVALRAYVAELRLAQ